MVSEDAFLATKTSFTVLGTFFQSVVDEYGEQRAVALYGRQGRALGGIIAELFSQYMLSPDREERVAADLHEIYGKLGFVSETSTAKNRVHMDSYRCPIYEGLRAAGLGHGTIQCMCMAYVGQEASRLKELHPDADRLVCEYRSSADGCCREEFRLPVL